MRGSWERVAVVGAVGCGKTALAGELAERLGVPHVELDRLRYGPEWTTVADELFRREVAQCAGTDRWVIDGNFSLVQDITWLRAQRLVWVDFSLPVTLLRLVKRTVLRMVRGESFSGGQRERIGRLLTRDSILFWAIRTHVRRRRCYEEMIDDPRYAHLQIDRLRSPASVRDWLKHTPRHSALAPVEAK